MKTLLGAAFLGSCLLAWACGSLNDPPTGPGPTPEPVGVTPTAQPGANPTPTPLFAPVAPKPTPTPEPSPNPSPGATPQPPPETAGGCGAPIPPDLSQINVKVHLKAGDTWVIDSTPLVGPDAEYCAKIGFTDGRSICAVRPEGNPERQACELYVIGRAADTGRPGPTWYLGGGFCSGRAAGCENHPENQYQVLAYRGGVYRACGRNGVCGEVSVDK